MCPSYYNYFASSSSIISVMVSFHLNIPQVYKPSSN